MPYWRVSKKWLWVRRYKWRLILAVLVALGLLLSVSTPAKAALLYEQAVEGESQTLPGIAQVTWYSTLPLELDTTTALIGSMAGRVYNHASYPNEDFIGRIENTGGAEVEDSAPVDIPATDDSTWSCFGFTTPTIGIDEVDYVRFYGSSTSGADYWYKRSTTDVQASWLSTNTGGGSSPRDFAVRFYDTYACDGQICGNGWIEGTEECDDGDTENGDGCSSVCAEESGWACTGEPSSCYQIGVCGNDVCDIDTWVDYPENICSCPEDCDESTLDSIGTGIQSVFGRPLYLGLWQGATYDWGATAIATVTFDFDLDSSTAGGWADHATANNVLWQPPSTSDPLGDDHASIVALATPEDMAVTSAVDLYRFRSRVANVICADVDRTTYTDGDWSDWQEFSLSSSTIPGYYSDATVAAVSPSLYSPPSWDGQWSTFGTFLHQFMTWFLVPDFNGLWNAVLQLLDTFWDLWPFSWVEALMDEVDKERPASVYPLSFADATIADTEPIGLDNIRAQWVALLPGPVSTITDILAYVAYGAVLIVMVVFGFIRRFKK